MERPQRATEPRRARSAVVGRGAHRGADVVAARPSAEREAAHTILGGRCWRRAGASASSSARGRPSAFCVAARSDGSTATRARRLSTSCAAPRCASAGAPTAACSLTRSTVVSAARRGRARRWEPRRLPSRSRKISRRGDTPSRTTRSARDHPRGRKHGRGRGRGRGRTKLSTASIRVPFGSSCSSRALVLQAVARRRGARQSPPACGSSRHATTRRGGELATARQRAVECAPSRRSRRRRPRR